jgi:hypothetical protein
MRSRPDCGTINANGVASSKRKKPPRQGAQDPCPVNGWVLCLADGTEKNLLTDEQPAIQANRLNANKTKTETKKEQIV